MANGVRTWIHCGLVLASLGTVSVRAEDAAVGRTEDNSAQLEFFEKKVRPLLIAKCQDCHGPDDAQSGLRVDTLGGLLRGGTRGPAIVPGKPAASLLVSVMKHGETLKMPPKEKPERDEIAIVTQWIEAGAHWPDSGEALAQADKPPVLEPEITAEQRSFWAYSAMVRHATPVVKQPEWLRSPVDAFILSNLEAAGLSPAPPCDRRTLLRRVTFDLTGLPPTPEEVAEFLGDQSPDALERVVDRLLASPHYGERFGRHWLDVARYADSNGLDENLAHGLAYRYRDYVIRAFNRDLPFDRFLTEQLAGDLLPEESVESVADGLSATGFLVLGAKMLAEDDPVKMQMDIIDEQIDTVGKAFLGQTLGCARCHDHKFDPISAEDYYGLAGIFKSTRTMENFNVVARWQERPLATTAQLAERKQRQDQVDEKQQEIQQQIEQENQRLLTAERRRLGEYLLAATTQQWRDELKTTTPSLGEKAATLEMPGVQILEAEGFQRGNVLKDTSNYGLGIGVLVNRGEAPNFVEHDIEVARAGWYQLEVRYAAAAARPVALTINGTIRDTNFAAGVTGGWQPGNQVWQVAGFVELKAGRNVLRLEQPQAFPHIDKLLLAPAPAELAMLSIPTDAEVTECWPELVQGLRDVIAQAEKDPEGVLQAWRELLAGPRMEILKTLPLLAADYQDRARQIVDRGPDAALQSSEQALQKLLVDPKGAFAVPATIETHYAAAASTILTGLRSDKAALQAEVPQYPEAMAVSDQTIENVPIHYRGSHLTLGPVIPRRYLRIVDDGSVSAPGEATSGRLELARWLTSDSQPLTARVLVNRVWQWHFGSGIVKSADNFGTLGDLPSHPELLDQLAWDFRAEGWSLKQLHRKLILSSTYQMGTQVSEQAALVDPENRLRWKFPRRRLEAEAVRDAILAVCGELDTAMAGTMLPTANRAYVTSTASVNPAMYQSTRRSLYLPVVRSALYDVFQAFDFADPSVLSGERQSTTVAPQALFMMNSRLVSEQTLALADRLLAAELDDPSRVRAVYQAAYGRDPSDAETNRAVKYVMASTAQSDSPESPEARRRSWQSLCRAVIAANEFLFVE